MRLATLHYDTKQSEGVVKWDTDPDLTKPNVMLLDTLRDWIAELTITYNDLRKVTFSDMKDKVAACERCGNTLNDGSDICDQCGGEFK
jgi:hypothetical protein